MSDYEYRAQCVGERPLVRVPRDVIRAPTPPPVIQRVVERAPTPEPDIVERVFLGLFLIIGLFADRTVSERLFYEQLFYTNVP